MIEDIEKNIELIEKEKQEYLDGELDGDSDEDVDVEEMEFSLTEDEVLF